MGLELRPGCVPGTGSHAGRRPAPAQAAVSEDDILLWLSVWKRRMDVRQNVNLRAVRVAEFQGRNAICDVDWWQTPGTMNIRILCSEDLQRVYGYTAARARDDLERTVIHELMHIVTSGLYDDGSGRGFCRLYAQPAANARMEAITDNLAVMLLCRSAPGA